MNLLSEKQFEILNVIDKYGILSRKQILIFVSINEKNMRIALKKMEEQNLIQSLRLNIGKIHYITKAGSEYIGTINRGFTSSEKKLPNLATLSHSLKVNDCVIFKHQEYQNYDLKSVQIKSEREILQDVYNQIEFENYKERGKQLKMHAGNKIPDFIFEIKMPDDRFVRQAFEVELTKKNKRSLYKKLKWYADHKEDFTAVMYFYEDESIKNYIKQMRIDYEELSHFSLAFQKMEGKEQAYV